MQRGRQEEEMFVRVAAEQDIREGALQRFEADRRLVTVVRIGDRVLSFDDACPHRGCSLAEDGDLRGSVLVCTCHGSEFDVTSGQVLQGPSKAPLTMHDAKVEGAAVLVDV
jgi:nitrite reductase/ring-hydroxylating ferredoxin subunit